MAPRWLPRGGRLLCHLGFPHHRAPPRPPGGRARSAISCRDFWARRARRLLPALVGVTIVITLACAVLAPDAVPRLRADIPSALGFVANWRLLLHKDSYFETMGRPPLLLHLWSFGVEEQFYLFWPWVVLLVLRFTRRPTRALCWVAGLGAVVSALLMGLLFVPGHDPSSVYYGHLHPLRGAHARGGPGCGRARPLGRAGNLRRAAGGDGPADLSAPVPARSGRPEPDVGRRVSGSSPLPASPC